MKRLSRKILTNPSLSDKNKCMLLYLSVLQKNYHPSLNQIAKDMGWSKSKVVRCLNELNNEGFITVLSGDSVSPNTYIVKEGI